MNDARRTLLAVYSVALIAAAGGFIVMTWTQGKKLDLVIGDFNLQAFVEAGSVGKIIVTTAMAAVIWLAVCSLYIALRNPEGRARRAAALRGHAPGGGTVEYSAESLAAVVADDLERLPDVVAATPVVYERRGQAELEVDAVIAPGASIGHVTAAIAHAAEDSLRERAGIVLSRRPVVRLQHAEGDEAPAVRIPRPAEPAIEDDDLAGLPWPEWQGAPQREPPREDDV